MPNIIRVKLDLTKVLEEHLFNGKNGAKYLDVALLPVRESKYGETHVALQDLPRAERDAGKKGPILGNATEKLSTGYQPDAPADVDQTRTRTAPPRSVPSRSQPTERQMANQDGEVPF